MGIFLRTLKLRIRSMTIKVAGFNPRIICFGTITVYLIVLWLWLCTKIMEIMLYNTISHCAYMHLYFVLVESIKTKIGLLLQYVLYT